MLPANDIHHSPEDIARGVYRMLISQADAFETAAENSGRDFCVYRDARDRAVHYGRGGKFSLELISPGAIDKLVVVGPKAPKQYVFRSKHGDTIANLEYLPNWLNAEARANRRAAATIAAMYPHFEESTDDDQD